MNSVQFLEEVKGSPLCPANFETIYEEFQQFQKAVLDTLQQVHKVCEDNGIPYQVAYGSLLGLIRDGGQIPWDYDIDIIVPYEEKARLIAALQKDLGPKYYFYCPDTHPKCRHQIMRVSPAEFKTEALHVDVFFYVGTPEDPQERKAYARQVKQVSSARFGKLVNIREETLGKPLPMLKLFLKRRLPVLFTSLAKLDREYRRLCSKYSSREATYCISADVFATWKEIPSALLWETQLMDCSYGTVRVPVHYEQLLTMMYGDYRTVPPLKSRIGEVLIHHERIKSFPKNT